MRRSSIMDAGRQKARVLGTDSTSFRSTMWRESLPPTNRHLCYPQDSIHKAPFKVSRLPADNVRNNFRTISERTRPASARPMSDRTPSARLGSARPLSTVRASPKFFSPRSHIEDHPYFRRDSVRLNRAHEHIIAVRQNAHTKVSHDFLRKWKTGPQLASDIQKRMGTQPATTRAIKRGGRQVYHFSEDELDGAKKVFLELREMWRGQYFGELSIINKTFRTASVVSKSSCKLLVVSKLMFQRLGLDHGDGAEQLLRDPNEQGFTNDSDSLQALMEDDFRWMNLRNDIAIDSTFGSNFAISTHAEPQIVHKANTIFAEL